MIYAIVPLNLTEDQGIALKKKVEELQATNGEKATLSSIPAVRHVYSDYAPVYFITYEGTARELSDALGYGNDLSIGTGIVMRIGSNFGYASTNLWDWMEVHNGKR